LPTKKQLERTNRKAFSWPSKCIENYFLMKILLNNFIFAILFECFLFIILLYFINQENVERRRQKIKTKCEVSNLMYVKNNVHRAHCSLYYYISILSLIIIMQATNKCENRANTSQSASTKLNVMQLIRTYHCWREYKLEHKVKHSLIFLFFFFLVSIASSTFSLSSFLHCY